MNVRAKSPHICQMKIVLDMDSTFPCLGGMKTTRFYLGKRTDFGVAKLFVEVRNNEDGSIVNRKELTYDRHNDIGIEWSFAGKAPHLCGKLIVWDLIGTKGWSPEVSDAGRRIMNNLLIGLPRGEWKMKASVFIKHLAWRHRWRYFVNRLKRTFKRKDMDEQTSIL